MLVIIIAGSIAASFYLITRHNPQEFALNVYPSQLRGNAIAGQVVVLLVTIANNGSNENGGGTFAISAAAGGLPVSVYPQAIGAGQVAEVTVVPTIDTVGNNVSVKVQAERDGLTQTKSVTFAVVPGDNAVGGYAAQLRDTFVQWLQVNHPELGITNQTTWMGTIVSPQWLVVTHYLFFSKDWEMHIYWHVMIPPYDWARIDLRHRTTELTPSFSFEISSLNASLPPHEIPTSDTTWR